MELTYLDSKAVVDLLIVGAGPAGLAAAIAAKQAGLTYRIVEKGTVVNSILHFPSYMIFFTTAELLEIGGLPFTTPYAKPTRAEALGYYRRVVDAHELEISLNEKVVSIRREANAETDETVFAVVTCAVSGAERCRRARAVIFATGYYDHPNLLRVPGEDLPHVSHYYKEPHQYFRRPVVVVGGRNSAAETALDLYRAGVRVTLVHRGPALAGIKQWVKPDIESRINEGSIAARFDTHVVRILPSSVIVDRDGELEEVPADGVLLMTGYSADLELLRGAGVLVDQGMPRYDPETFETNVPGLFLAGGVISGKDTSPIFIENGRFHGEKIVRWLTRRGVLSS